MSSLLVHAGLLAWLSVSFNAASGGHVAVLDIQVESGAKSEKTRPPSRKAMTPPVSKQAVVATSATLPEPRAVTAAREVGAPGIRASYIAGLRAAIESMKTYPALARARRQEGRVEIAFTLRKDGRIDEVSVTRSSSFSSLDEAGANTVSRLARFKPIPDEVSRDDLRLVLPIEFKLEE